MTFVIHKASDSQYYFTIVAGNNKVLCTSETYTQKESAKGTIEAIRLGMSSVEIKDLTRTD